MYRAIESRFVQSMRTEWANERAWQIERWRFFDLALALNEEEILAKHHRKRWAHTIKIIYQIYILIQRCFLSISSTFLFGTQLRRQVVAWWKRKREYPVRSIDKPQTHENKNKCFFTRFLYKRRPILFLPVFNMICHTSPFRQAFFVYEIVICYFRNYLYLFASIQRKVSFTLWEKMSFVSTLVTTSANVCRSDT